MLRLLVIGLGVFLVLSVGGWLLVNIYTQPEEIVSVTEVKISVPRWYVYQTLTDDKQMKSWAKEVLPVDKTKIYNVHNAPNVEVAGMSHWKVQQGKKYYQLGDDSTKFVGYKALKTSDYETNEEYAFMLRDAGNNGTFVEILSVTKVPKPYNFLAWFNNKQRYYNNTTQNIADRLKLVLDAQAVHVPAKPSMIQVVSQ